MKKIAAASALATLVLAGPASASSVTPAGAKALTDGLARYFGREIFDKGILTVKANGDHYDLTYEINSAKLGLPADGPRIQAGPVTVGMTPSEDGSTLAFVLDQPAMSLSYTSGKTGAAVEMAETLKACSGRGTFTIKTGAMTDQKTQCDSATMTMRTPFQTVDATLGKAEFTTSFEPAGGGTDFNLTGDIRDLVETVTMLDPKNPKPPQALRADNVHEEMAVTGIAGARLLDIATSLSDQKPGGTNTAGLEQVRQKLKAALPLWQSLQARLRYDNFSMGTPKGIVRVGALDSRFSSGGLVKDATVNSTITMSKLVLPDGMVPDWATALIPADATVDLKLSGLDLESVAGKLIDGMGERKGDSPAMTLPAIMLPVLANSRLAFNESLQAPGYDVKGQGETSVLPTQKGSATVTASGLDAVMDAFTKGAAAMPNAQQGVMGVAFLKGLAKTGPDGRLVWNIDFDAGTKTVTVNGQSFGGGGGQRSKP